MLFLVMSSTIGVFLVEREPSHRSSWQANHAISPEQNIFSEVHTIQILKSLQGTLLDIQMRYVVASAVTDTHTHTHKTTTVTLAHAPRVNESVQHCRCAQLLSALHSVI